MAKECLWYNGELGNYVLLDFDPNGLTNNEIIEKAKEILKEEYGFNKNDWRRVLETLYLLDTNNLETIKEN